MYPLTHLLSVSLESQALLDQVVPALRQHGWQVVQSFDLQTARQSHAGCTCPHHGTEQCNCQMAVFLVYGEASLPHTLVAHGRDGLTELSLAGASNPAADRRLANRIRQALNAPLGQSNEFTLDEA